MERRMTDQPPLFILGSSGHANEIAVYARSVNPDRAVLFVDDSVSGDSCITYQQYLDLIPAGGESVMGSGRIENRRRMLEQIRPPFATIVHPSATVIGQLGPGCVVAPGAVLAARSHLAEHVLVNYNATIGHDSTVHRLSVVGPLAAIGGWVDVEEEVYVGAGAVVRERLRLGRGSIAAMGSVIVADVPPGLVAVGVPATLKERSELGGNWLRDRS
jgi:sugar O-acyltransferase (sialic acid O-acetyltransferase NeuD family)